MNDERITTYSSQPAASCARARRSTSSTSTTTTYNCNGRLLSHKIFTIARSKENTIKMPHNPSLARHEHDAKEMDERDGKRGRKGKKGGDGEGEDDGGEGEREKK